MEVTQTPIQSFTEKCREVLGEYKKNVESSISASVAYLIARFESLERPYAVAITAYCLSLCQEDRSLALSAWGKLKGLATEEGDCRMWASRSDLRLANEVQGYKVPPPQAITVETTAYALLTAVANKDMEWADSAVCWLSKQENYGGGFKSTQDTIVALEALSDYALSRSSSLSTKLDLHFTAIGRNQKAKLTMDKPGERVETELKRLLGSKIHVHASGQGRAKMKVVMAYHALQPEDTCQHLSISITVQGKVKYTARVLDNYDYVDYDEEGGRKEEVEERDVHHSKIEWFDARSRRRRDTEESLKTAVEYVVCVSHDLSRNLSGMAIADITLLSGFVALTEDLDKLKELSDRYISHYETTQGRVLLYFDEIPEGRECITFGAEQKVQIGLLQPAPASFYDYYEPDRKCTVFYSAPQRSRMVSTLCSGEVCQCAEKPCHSEKKTFEMRKKKARIDFACYFPTVEYGYEVKINHMSEKSNFELYHTTVTDILRATGDESVAKGSVRVFAKRRQCKGTLQTDKTYLIMGKDGTTTDTLGEMQYLLDSSSWVEQLPSDSQCRASKRRLQCNVLNAFVSQYKTDGCTQ
ncbi:hypothetical protein SKAU_G00221120 [Synaphobranchus kaupii]|uniref:NTR domain-containing protein n=1 Tax=Synaphobranchus kaupii TaxID=118154 RepID=A0A9Q1FAY2_SYNKA|nr:hypothetical protein SKAU_G00221120 [Synaphobranchus kaupii]